MIFQSFILGFTTQISDPTAVSDASLLHTGQQQAGALVSCSPPSKQAVVIVGDLMAVHTQASAADVCIGWNAAVSSLG